MSNLQVTVFRLALMMWILWAAGPGLKSWPASAQSPTSTRRVNIPYFNGNVQFEQSAVFWFGRVNNTSNYADVRIGYNDGDLVVRLAAFDRQLWYDDTPAVNDLTAWDAATLYLNLNGNTGEAPPPSAYRFVAQLNHWQPRADYQAAYQGNGSGWTKAPLSFVTTSGWRGEGLNNGAEARGWTAEFRIPFSSLGLSGPPPAGSVWGLGLKLHDRDNESGTPIPDQSWPETTMDGQHPATWGQLHFGLPTYNPGVTTPGQEVTIRQGWQGVTVSDAGVGGHTNCGDAFNPNFFNGWGDANYAHTEDFNIQNQADVADWPCFSRYYVTFPLNTLPAGKTIISATLTLHQFGNSEPSEALPSMIQALTVAEDWDETTLTWNNAPLAVENVGAAWVDPLAGFPGWPGVPTQWDVSGAVAKAYAAGSPLRLALYSADSAYHSGKYFVSSDTGDWNEVARPTLQVLWGDPGFTLSATPTTRMIRAGGTAGYTLRVQHDANFNQRVTLQVGNSPTSTLTVNLASPTFFDHPGGQTILTLTDTHPPSYSSGLWYTIPVTATGGGVTKVTNVSLLVNGRLAYLPVLLK